MGNSSPIYVLFLQTGEEEKKKTEGGPAAASIGLASHLSPAF
jgi:hypothetical protein